MRQSSFPRSGVVLLGSNNVQSLLPTTLTSQAEAFLAAHRIQDALNLADQQRAKLQGATGVSSDQFEELQYVYQIIGFRFFSETSFAEAGKAFLAGELDPRIVVSYFATFRDKLFQEGDEVDLFSGVAAVMPTEESIEEIIRKNLVANYSPHLSPNTSEAHSAVELRDILERASKEMLLKYLIEWRKRRPTEPPDRAVAQVVDTVLVKLYVHLELTDALITFLYDHNSVMRSEIEPIFRATRQYRALCILYTQAGDERGMLRMWSKLHEMKYTDSEIPDPLTNMFELLSEKRDRLLITEWAIWLVKQDVERTIKLLTTSITTTKRKEKEKATTADELKILNDLEHASRPAGRAYLEYLVLSRRSTEPDLHNSLAMKCVDDLLACMADESVTKLWRAKMSSYTSNPLSRSAPSSLSSSTSFFSYFASTTPDSAAKRARLKTLLFLQGSNLYPISAIRVRLADRRDLLALELALLDGKLANHREALTTLVHVLHDTVSAEAYCALGGVVIPSNVAQSVAADCGIHEWFSVFLPVVPPKSKFKLPVEESAVNEATRKGLLRLLLEISMNDSNAAPERTALLLDSQAQNLEVTEVISLVPPNWPLQLISPLLSRSFRRTLHIRHEGLIQKAMSAGQNLQVAEESWSLFRDAGHVIEEVTDDEVDGDDGEEKDEFSEKDVEKDREYFTVSPTEPHEIVHRADKGRRQNMTPGQGWLVGSTDSSLTSTVCR